MQQNHFLKAGMLAESIRKRSVLNKFSNTDKLVRLTPGPGRKGSRYAPGSDTEQVVTGGSVPSRDAGCVRSLFTCLCNDLLCMGAVPGGFMYHLLSDDDLTEEQVRETMQMLQGLAKQDGMSYLGGDIQVSYQVTGAVSNITVLGEVPKGKQVSNTGLQPGMDIVMTKYAGLLGTAWLVRQGDMDRLSRLPDELIATAGKFGENLYSKAEAGIAWEAGVTAMQNTSEGGVFGDLWNFAEGSGVGVLVDLKAIPIRQETIEICERYDLNPYLIPAGGALLMGTYHGEELVEKMMAAGYQGTVVGHVTEGKERIVLNGDERRALLPHGNEKEGNLYEACRRKRK